MPRAELPAIVPLRQFGEDTWLAPGFIEPVGDARASFALNGETATVRDGRRARADGRLAGACLAMASAVRNCVRLLSVPLTTALRFASTHPADFSASATGLVSSRRDIAPTWSRSTAPRSRFSTPGSPAPAASVRVSFPEIDPLLSPICPREGANQQICCYVALSVWILACA